MHESSDELEFRPDWTTDCEVSCSSRSENSPWAYYGENDVSIFSRLFLIGSFSYLQVMIRYMRAWMSLKFGQIRPLVSMVTDRVMMGKKTVSPLFLGFFFHPFLFILAGNDYMHGSSGEFEIQPDPTTDCGVSCP